VTTANVTTLNATTVIATTANVTTANITTGNVTNMSSGNVTITGGSINGTTLGATTASTANVTTLTTSSTVTINGGTANGVAYLNGSKVLTTGSALVFDGTNLGIGTTSPTGWGRTVSVSNTSTDSGFTFEGSTRKWGIGGGFTDGALRIYDFTAATERMRISATGDVGIGTSSPGAKLDVRGTVSAQADTAYYRIRRASAADVGYVTDSGTWGDSGADFAIGASSSNLRFYTNNSGTERMRLDSSGNLGIGTSSPAAKLEVNGGAARVVNTNGRVYIENGNTSGGAKIGVRGTSDTTDGYLAFETYSREFGRFDSSGNLGIGTSSPAYKLDVRGSAGNIASWSDGTTPGVLYSGGDYVGLTFPAQTGGFFINPTGNFCTISTNGSERARIDANGNLLVGTTSATPANANGVIAFGGADAGIIYLQRQTGTDQLRFYTGGNRLGYVNTASSILTLGTANFPLVFATNDTERARITSGGELMVGTTTSVSNGVLSVTKTGEIDLAGFWNQSSAGNGTALFVKRTNTGNLLYFVHSTSNTYVGQISTNGTTVSYTSASDARLKKNIVEATEAGSEIDALKVRAFDWKADNSHVKYGFIAQELIEVVPEAVSKSENPDGMMGVDYSKLVPMLVKEIQSLRTRLAAAGL
jgi:hypothetical protein